MSMKDNAEFQEFIDHYSRMLLRICFGGIFLFLAYGFAGAALKGELSLALGWVALTAILSTGALWSRRHYGHWPWVIE